MDIRVFSLFHTTWTIWVSISAPRGKAGHRGSLRRGGAGRKHGATGQSRVNNGARILTIVILNGETER